MDLKEEIADVIRTMANDINFNISPQIEEYLTLLIANSIFKKFEGLSLKESNTKESLYKLAEFNLIRATIITIELPEVHIRMAQSAYNKIFELYTDELAFELLTEIKNIVIILSGIKHFSIRNNLLSLIEFKGKSNYVNILLLKNGFLDIEIDE